MTDEAKDHQRRYREANKERRAAQGRAWRAANRERTRVTGRAWRAAHKDLVNARRRATYEACPEVWILSNIRVRCRAEGIPFDLTIDDIRPPEYCPVLGIKLQRNHRGSASGPAPHSPSVDRIIPERGYVKGNVIVVSHLANAIRQNASPEQIRRVADFYERLLKTEGGH